MSSHAITPVSAAPGKHPWSPAKVGMLAFLGSEVAFFSTLIMTYCFYLKEIRESSPGPGVLWFLWNIPGTPWALWFTLAILGSICLLASSVTVHLAEMALHRNNRSGFLLLWGATILLGVTFLVLTALEWKELIVDRGLSLNRNMFGTCFFTLVGFHAAHVTGGVIMLSAVWALVWRKRLGPTSQAPMLVSWYWHFVDVVWVVVFTLVYLIGR